MRLFQLFRLGSGGGGRGVFPLEATSVAEPFHFDQAPGPAPGPAPALKSTIFAIITEKYAFFALPDFQYFTETD